jgi:periplasmic protein TonB
MMLATDSLEARSAQVTRWGVAALLVIALHAGGAAFAFMRWQEEDNTDDAASAIVVQLVPVSNAAPTDTPDLTPGPLLEEAAPQVSKRAPEEVDKETPRVDRAPLAPNPEVLVPIPKPEEKKAEKTEEKDELREAESPTETAVVPLTSAPPKAEAKPVVTAAAPTSGMAAVDTRNNVAWQKSLVSHLNRYKRYPGAARTRGIQGVVNVQFSIDRSGRVMASHIVTGSGSTLLDAEALSVIQRASPLPAPPAHMPGDPVELALPIYFRIK